MRKLKLQELNRLDVASFKAVKKVPIVVVLDNIRSAMNVGSVFRTADAFAIERIVIAGITAKPPHKEITKTAIGATSSVEWSYDKNVVTALQTLKEDGYTIVAIEQTTNSQSLSDWKLPDESKVAIIMGNEVDGVSDDALALTDIAIEIPQYGTKHSLNVSVCAGVVMWELRKKLVEKEGSSKISDNS